MKKLIKKFREWRDERFRQRIDRVYFRTDEYGNNHALGANPEVYKKVSAGGLRGRIELKTHNVGN